MPSKAIYLFAPLILFMFFAGLLSAKIKIKHILRATLISTLISAVLAQLFITPPNSSWFNPVGMTGAIIFTGIVIFIGMLIIRAVFKGYILIRQKVGNFR
ncbi:hypothetical protein ACO1PF_04400 [Alkalibacterium sp. f15]|uniref:hypothetical protein n=1 Tax=Alkalibacterium sp. f15 TaxID=3414029 RepID=UPI003BF851A2